mmetsp:Transcript_113092/g.243644  ORF Transcript_113092/g.243644 Transcript_113092/m.243644 type:complete len:240 (-) Transcript_113092:421-1140(-)
MCQVLFADVEEILLVCPVVFCLFVPHTYFLSEFLVRNPNHIQLLDSWLFTQKFFDFFRVDILSSTNDHVFHSAYNTQVSIIIDDSLVSRVHKSIFLQGLFGFYWVFPLKFHVIVSLGANFTWGVSWHDVPFMVYDLTFHVWMHHACSGCFFDERVVGFNLEGDRARFRHSVCNSQVGYRHFLVESSQQRFRAYCACHDSCPDAVCFEFLLLEHIQIHLKHGGYALNACCFVFLDNLECF